MPFYGGTGSEASHSAADTRYAYLDATVHSLRAHFPYVVVAVLCEDDREAVEARGLPLLAVLLVEATPPILQLVGNGGAKLADAPALLAAASVIAVQTALKLADGAGKSAAGGGGDSAASGAWLAEAAQVRNTPTAP